MKSRLILLLKIYKMVLLMRKHAEKQFVLQGHTFKQKIGIQFTLIVERCYYVLIFLSKCNIVLYYFVKINKLLFEYYLNKILCQSNGLV